VHSNSFEIFSEFNLIFSEEIIQYSRTFVPQVQTSYNEAHTPLIDTHKTKQKKTKNLVS
jgi:hypothetical protein